MASEYSPTARRAVIAAGVVGALLLAALGFFWWSRPPQMGADEEAFTAVDALFTAVTARDEKLLGQCERRLHALRDDGKLPAGAADHLDGVIAEARSGGWREGAKRLYAFMRAQRREGTHERRPRKEAVGQSARKR